jgi:hypothetical protein
LAGLGFAVLEEELDDPESELDELDDEEPEPESPELAGGTDADEPLRESVR